MQKNSAASTELLFRRSRILLLAAVAVAVLAVVSISLFTAWYLRQQAELHAVAMTQNFARSTGQTIEGMISTIDVGLLASADEIGNAIATGKPVEKSITQTLVRQTGRLPMVAYVRATNERGETIYGPRVSRPPISISDRDYFIRLRDDPGAGLVLVDPVIGRISKRWVWVLARRINKPDGSFGGVVYAALYTDDVDKLLSHIKLGAAGFVSLRSADRALVARYPSAASVNMAIGGKRLSASGEEALSANPQEGSYVSGATSLDQISRIHSYRQNEKYGFRINVGIPVEEALAQWRTQAGLISVLAAAFILSSLVFTRLIGRAWRRQRQNIIALEASNARSRAIIDASPVPHAINDDQGNVSYTNVSFVNTFGYTLADIPTLEQWWSKAYPDPAYRQWVMETWQAHVEQSRRENKSFVPVEAEIRCKDGAVKSALVDAVQIGEGPDAIHMVTLYDFTERKRAEHEREQYLKFFQLSIDPMCIADPFGCFKQVNPAFVRLTGFSAGELLGKPFLDFVLPEDRKRTADEMKRQVEVRPSMNFENRYVCKDGRVVLLSWTAFFSAGDGVTFATARDITERERMQSELRTLSRSVEQSPVSIVITDPQGNIEYVNPFFCRTTGYSAPEVIGQNPRAIRSGNMPAEFYQGLWTTITAGKAWSGEIENRRRNGELFWESATISPVFDNSGAITHFIGIKEDITERKRHQETLLRLNADLERRVADRTRDLQASNQELSAFSYSVAHDLRAPVRAINGYGEMVLEASEGKLDPTATEYLKRVVAGSRRMGTLIDDLLSLSRLSRQELRRHDFDLSKLAATVVEVIAAADPKRSVVVSVQPDMKINGDHGLIRAVLENLIGNAWKFTAKTATARIEIGVDRRESGDVYFIRDNGAGFDMQYAHKLFAPFQRLHHRDEFEGTGIGLATVRKIIERHDGKIWIESVPMQGTTVFFSISNSL